MTQEEKQLLLKDLCARLPYGVKVDVNFYYATKGLSCDLLQDFITDEKSVRPYLRPMSSMTKEEYEELKSVEPYYGLAPFGFIGDWGPNFEVLDWLNKHHFDYRGLIKKGLALEALENMYVL